MGFSTHISNQQLPSLGAYYPSAANVAVDVNHAAREETVFNLLAKYQLGEGGSTGRCKFRIVWICRGPDGTDREVIDTLEDSTITVNTSAGTAVVRSFQRVRDLYACKNGVWSSFAIRLRRDAVAFRVEPAEAGDTENPGKVWFDVEGLP